MTQNLEMGALLGDPECRYRYDERLGILCAGGEPTEREYAIAREEVMRYHREMHPAKYPPAQLDLHISAH